MVGRFLREVFLYSLPIAAGIMLYAFSYRTTFPAPRISDNISLNEKMRFYKRTGPEHLDLFAVGSSMTLNNLNSAEVIAHFGAVRYMNFGAWGFSLRNTRDMILALQARNQASTVLVCANLMEFSTEIPDLPLDTAKLMRYLWHDPEAFAYLREPKPSYYLTNMVSNRIRMNDPNNYEYLRFDANGGCTLDVADDKRPDDRWNKPAPPPEAMIDSAYNDVAGIGKALAARHVRLIWLHSPFREGVSTTAVHQRVLAHIARLRGILEPMGHTVLDAEAETWPDSLYSDHSHFRSIGARLFTRECLGQLDH